MKRVLILAFVAAALSSCQTQDRSASQTVSGTRYCQSVGTKQPPRCYEAKPGQMIAQPVSAPEPRPRVIVNRDPQFWLNAGDALNRAAWAGVDPNRPAITECRQFGARVVCTTH